MANAVGQVGQVLLLQQSYTLSGNVPRISQVREYGTDITLHSSLCTCNRSSMITVDLRANLLAQWRKPFAHHQYPFYHVPVDLFSIYQYKCMRSRQKPFKDLSTLNLLTKVWSIQISALLQAHGARSVRPLDLSSCSVLCVHLQSTKVESSIA